jgi:hypothetical protein
MHPRSSSDPANRRDDPPPDLETPPRPRPGRPGSLRLPDPHALGHATRPGFVRTRRLPHAGGADLNCPNTLGRRCPPPNRPGSTHPFCPNAVEGWRRPPILCECCRPAPSLGRSNPAAQTRFVRMPRTDRADRRGISPAPIQFVRMPRNGRRAPAAAPALAAYPRGAAATARSPRTSRRPCRRRCTRSPGRASPRAASSRTARCSAPARRSRRSGGRWRWRRRSR